MRVDEVIPLEYASTRVKAYVYMGINKTTQEYYFGYREANVKKNRTSDVDLPKYKTSSQIVKSKFNEFEWKILAEFDNGNDAYDFEQQLIFENWGDPLLLNKQYRLLNGEKRFKKQAGEPGYWLGKSRPASANKKASEKLKGHAGFWTGKKQSPETLIKKSKSMQGKNTWAVGSVRSQETKDKTAASMQGKNTWTKGKVWWNNGNKTMTSVESPGPGWVRGRAGIGSRR